MDVDSVDKASCKTCGGRSLVDGIGSISGSMLSTIGLEVVSSINLELSWKAVTKKRCSNGDEGSELESQESWRIFRVRYGRGTFHSIFFCNDREPFVQSL